MNSITPNKKKEKVGGQIFEELFFKYLQQTYDISKEDLSKIVLDKKNINDSFPVEILCSSSLSSLESIVKFLRENRDLSYNIIGELLDRNPKTLAVTYAVARRKMPKRFSANVESDVVRIPFTAFLRRLSILECICYYLKNSDPRNSYAAIARILNKDQRTVWTVCKRAEKKLEQKNLKERSEKKHGR